MKIILTIILVVLASCGSDKITKTNSENVYINCSQVITVTVASYAEIPQEGESFIDDQGVMRTSEGILKVESGTSISADICVSEDNDNITLTGTANIDVGL